MALVVFLRGVNVGGHKKFKPATLGQQLASFDVVNVGAAGTFVVRKAVSRATIRNQILQKLGFAAELMICPVAELLKLASKQPFPDELASPDARLFVSILTQRPRRLPPLPVFQPDGDTWQVKVFGVQGRFVLSLHRQTSQRLIYPNEVVERNFGVSATTRNWNTIVKLCEILKG